MTPLAPCMLFFSGKITLSQVLARFHHAKLCCYGKKKKKKKKKSFITKEIAPHSFIREGKTHNKRAMIRDHIRSRNNED